MSDLSKHNTFPWRWWIVALILPAVMEGMNPEDLAKSAENMVCELELRENTPIDNLTGIECTIIDIAQRCTCTSPIIPIPSYVTMKKISGPKPKGAEPGKWYIEDMNHTCRSDIPVICPFGFYCAGGLESPKACSAGDHCQLGQPAEGRKCEEGYFCPFPAGPKLECLDGCRCPEGSSKPDPCDGGWVCKGGHMTKCPSGHFCPFASNVSRDCDLLAYCPEGSASQNRTFIGLSFLVMTFSAFFVGGMVYKKAVQYDFIVALLVGVLIALMLLVDKTLSGFLFLQWLTVAVNWLIIKLGQGKCPPIASTLVLITTLAAAITVVGWTHPPWAILAGGLIMVVLMGWLMTRGTFALVVLGRLVCSLVFLSLMIAVYIVDSVFAWAYMGIMVVLVVALVIFQVVQGVRQGRGMMGVSFRAAVWDAPSLGTDSEAGLNGPALARNALLGVQVVDAGSGDAEGAAGNLSQGVQDGGVSFNLQEVNYDLPDGLRLLNKVDCRIGAGRLVAVMGPSGCGKSTLLTVLRGSGASGFVTGRLEVNGQQATDLGFLRRVTGFVPQDDILLGELLVEENIRFQALLRLASGTRPEQVDEVVARVAKDLMLTDLLDKRVGTPEQRGVSGGQRKRVSIAMELVTNPLLLFADEPTSGLDSTTSHEVVGCLRKASAGKMTVIVVIHQPRYDTLLLFDELILLGKGGHCVYGGPTANVVTYFKDQLNITFEDQTNPADTLLDVLRPPHLIPEECAKTWSRCMPLMVADVKTVDEAPASAFYRPPQPFIRAVMLYMDRSLRSTIEARSVLLINQGLNAGATIILCTVLEYKNLTEFLMQSAFACLFLMLLQGVAAQRIFGAELLMTMREASVGMPMMAYFVAKDLAALFELTLSAVVFTVTYVCFSGSEVNLAGLLGATWAFLYVVFGMSYIFSLVLKPGSSQMAAVVAAFVAFCVSGVYQPSLPEIIKGMGGRAWFIPALSPLRWLWAFMLTDEVKNGITETVKSAGKKTLSEKGYNIDFLDQCWDGYGSDSATLAEAWKSGRGWVCGLSEMLLLGLIFRFIAGITFMVSIYAQTSGLARFFGKSSGVWQLPGNILKLLCVSFLVLFLIVEVWVLGIINGREVWERLGSKS